MADSLADRPRVVVASGNKFHAYHMARGAERANLLQRFVITIFDKRESGIPRSRIAEVRGPAYLARALEQLPFPIAQTWAYYLGDNWFDKAASRYAGEGDIFHAFNHHGLYGIRAAKRQGIKTIVERSSAHPNVQQAILRDEYSRYGLNYPAGAKAIVEKHLQEYAEADWIMVCSDFVYRSMVAEGIPANKLRQVHLGFAPQNFYPGPKLDDKFRVVFVGALSLQKGLQYLLEGFRLANLPADKAELVLAGQPFPDARAFLPKYAGLYRRLNFVPHSDLASVYQSGSVFVLPSLQDGFGMVVYEAAACGLPVIISENVGAAVRDGEEGFVVPIRSAEAIAEKLVYLYTHPEERAHMGQAASQFVSQFTWERYQRELVTHYKEIWYGPG